MVWQVIHIVLVLDFLFLFSYLSDGYFICEGNYLSVQYYGEDRQLQVRHISPHEPLDTSPQSRSSLRPLTPVKEDSVATKLFDLSLSPGAVLESQAQADGGRGRQATVYKVTTKTKMRVRIKTEHTATEVCATEIDFVTV